MDNGTSINDAIHGLIHMTAYEKKIISTSGFNRLHDVYQNSTLYLTFPCNRTKRFEHSIGTMKLCSDMFYYSILNAERDELDRFYECAEKHISGILSKINRQESEFNCDIYFAGRLDLKVEDLRSLEMDEQRRAFIPHGVPEKYTAIQVILMEAVRTAALLHDIGHPPFSHIVESAMKKAYATVDKKRNASPDAMTAREKDFLNALDSFFNIENGRPAKKLHEQMGDTITDIILSSLVRPFSKEEARRNAKQLPENLFSAVVYHAVMGMYGEEPFFSALHRIVDSDIDGDRLDYLTRAAKNSGVDVGKIDYNRIISDMRLYYIDNKNEPEEDSRFYFCLPIKAINSVEDFFRRRYNLYKDIIYHHHVTKTDFLLQSTVYGLMIDHLSSDEPSTVPEAAALIPFDISGLWHPLNPSQIRGKEKTKDNLVQWNDAWLMTVLKQIYYRDYAEKAGAELQGTEKMRIFRQLSELLLNEKYYISLTKRNNDFKILDNAIKNSLKGKKTELDGILNRVEQEPEDGIKGAEEGSGRPDISQLDGTIKVVREIQQYCDSEKNTNGFIASLLNSKFDAINKGDKHFYDIVEDAVSISVKETYETVGLKVEDEIVAPVILDVGVGTRAPVYFYGVSSAESDVNGRFAVLTDVSGIVEILSYELQHFPPFYLYIMLDEPERNTATLKERFLRSAGEKIAESVFREIRDIFTDDTED